MVNGACSNSSLKEDQTTVVRKDFYKPSGSSIYAQTDAEGFRNTVVGLNLYIGKV